MRIIKLLTVVLLLCSACVSQQQDKNEKVVLAYVTSWTSIMPDPNYLTHINYAFGHVNETFNGVMINQPPRQGRANNDGRPTSEDRLKSIVALKKQKPSLKIMLSIGGWGSGNFSEMAADETNRLAFAADCKKVVDQFGLDGIDMDWEYPTSSSGRISSSPDDTKNFTLLMRDIRNAIGKNKLLTFASPSNARYVDFKDVEPYIDFVNIMTYDMGNPPVHHTALFRSENTRRSSAEGVDAHIAAGIPVNKLNLGMAFYGRATHDSIPNSIDYKNIIKLTGFSQQWDDVSKTPYLSDDNGKMVVTYDDARSIASKCEYLLEKGMLGAMYWEYNGDDEDGTLRKAVFNGVMKKQ